MISKYAGTCRYCKRPTKAGVDQYDLDSKTGYHSQCQEELENQPPSREQFELAERLQYRQFSWLDLRSVSGESFDEPERNGSKASDTASIGDLRGGQEY